MIRCSFPASLPGQRYDVRRENHRCAKLDRLLGRVGCSPVRPPCCSGRWRHCALLLCRRSRRRAKLSSNAIAKNSSAQFLNWPACNLTPRRIGCLGFWRRLLKNLEGMFARLVDVAATEQIHEMRFEDGAESPGRWQTYRYLVKRLVEGSPEPFTELRVGPDPNAPTPAPADGFLVVGHFEKLLGYLLPQYRQDSRFRYLGRVREAGQASWTGLVAFAQRTDSVQPLGNIQLTGGRVARMQGLVWIK